MPASAFRSYDSDRGIGALENGPGNFFNQFFPEPGTAEIVGVEVVEGITDFVELYFSNEGISLPEKLEGETRFGLPKLEGAFCDIDLLGYIRDKLPFRGKKLRRVELFGAAPRLP